MLEKIFVELEHKGSRRAALLHPRVVLTWDNAAWWAKNQGIVLFGGNHGLQE